MEFLEGGITVSKFTLKVLWLENNLAISIDEIINNLIVPLTLYFFWPRIDAWAKIKVALEVRPWLSGPEKTRILNEITELINYWQERKVRYDFVDAQLRFPNVLFIGNNGML